MISPAVLPHSIQIFPLVGVDGEGAEVYDDPTACPARLYTRRAAAAGSDGVVFVTTQMCQVQPLAFDPVGAMVRHGDTGWVVGSVEKSSLLNRRHHDDLVLTGERVVVAEPEVEP